MKQSIFSLLIIFITGIIISIGLPSCRKDKFQATIKQYDSVQIKNYIAANGLTGFQKDTIGGDTTGMYYQVLNPGTQTISGVPVTPIQYSDKVAFVYSERTLDGTYTLADTINNHFYDYVGHIHGDGFPLGLQTALHNLLKYPDAAIRVLIPSHLAYGKNGSGSGSSQVANNRIAGNESMDFYVHAISSDDHIKNFNKYDDMVIQNYMTANSLTGYSKVGVKLPVGMQFNGDTTTHYYYYKTLISATTNDPIISGSTITCTYTGQLLNGSIFDGNHNGVNIATFAIASFATFGNIDLLENHAVAGSEVSVLLPSALGYGLAAQSGIPAFSCMRFTWNVLTVTP